MRRIALIACLVMLPLAGTAQNTLPPGNPSAAVDDGVGPRPDTAFLTTLRVVTDADYPPFHYYDEDGQLAGLNIEVARAVCRELAVPCDIRAPGWDALIPALETGDADVAAASLAITPASVGRLDFTRGYYQTPARFVVKRDRPPSGVAPRDFAGQRIAVVAGSAHEAFLRAFYAGSRIEPQPDAAAARAALQGGRVDVLFGDSFGLMFWLNGQSSVQCCQFRGRGFLEARFFGEGVGLAVKRGNTRLREVLDYALARVRASGRLEELMLRYFPQSPS